MKILTPIPQQQSMADMSAASTSLFFPQSGNSNNNGNQHQHQHQSMNCDQSTVVADTITIDLSHNNINTTNNSNISSATALTAAAEEVGSALDTLWNKFQLRHSPEVLAVTSLSLSLLAMAAQNAYRRYVWHAAHCSIVMNCRTLVHYRPIPTRLPFVTSLH